MEQIYWDVLQDQDFGEVVVCLPDPIVFRVLIGREFDDCPVDVLPDLAEFKKGCDSSRPIGLVILV
jgi:hypothetical protein